VVGSRSRLDPTDPDGSDGSDEVRLRLDRRGARSILGQVDEGVHRRGAVGQRHQCAAVQDAAAGAASLGPTEARSNLVDANRDGLDAQVPSEGHHVVDERLGV
jgi:hypothetical protein